MRVTLDLRGALVTSVPELGLDAIRNTGGRKHVRHRQAFLCDLLSQAYSGQRTHKANPAALSFGCAELKAGLRTDDYRPLIRPLFSFPETNGNYSRERALTKQYQLRPSIRAALDGVMRGTEPLAVIDAASGLPVTPACMGLNGIPAGVDDRFSVPSVVEVPLGQIDHAIGVVTEAIGRVGAMYPVREDKPDGCTLGEAQQSLYVCRSWADSAVGGMPNRYKLTKSGRLGPDGFHTIQLPAAVRGLLFDASCLADYDLASAHFSIFRSRAQSLGFDTNCANGYMVHKERYHGRWQNETGHSNASDFKAIAISWLTGGTLSASARTEAGKKLGRAAVEILKADAFVTELRREAREGMKLIVAAMPTETTGKAETTYTNAVGAKLRLPDKARAQGTYREKDFGKLCSHVLTGYEQWAIREVCSIAAGLKVVIYDGIIAEPGQKQAFADQVHDRSTALLGFPLRLDIKEAKLSAPVLTYGDEF